MTTERELMNTPIGQSAESSPEIIRARIRNLVRQRRKQLGLSQQALGDRVKTSRWAILRIESGQNDVDAGLAPQLAEVLNIPELERLVSQLTEPNLLPENTRDTVVPRMLSAPDLNRVRIVLADDFDLYRYIHRMIDGDADLRCPEVVVVVPTIHRAQVLFGIESPFHGHIEYQLKRLLDLTKSKYYERDSLQIFESDRVLASVAVTEGESHTEAIAWPLLAMPEKTREVDAWALPMTVITRPQTVARLAAHVDSLTAEEEVIKNTEALSRANSDDPESTPVFTRYFTSGVDTIEELDESEGFATALILVVALCPRKRYGMGRRVITYLRSQSRIDKVPSLFSNAVQDLDIQHARATEEGCSTSDRRPTRSSLAAALDVDDFIRRKSGVIPDLAFQLAASREMATFDLDVDPQRFVPVPLPPRLRLIHKTNTTGEARAPLAPRLFALELIPDTLNPELQRLEERADIDKFGVLDLVEPSERLNDFLTEAATDGFLAEVLTRFGIVPR